MIKLFQAIITFLVVVYVLTKLALNPALILLIVAPLIIFFIYTFNKAKEEVDESNSEKSTTTNKDLHPSANLEESTAPIQSSNVAKETKYFKTTVSGVIFKNKDGISRQDIIKQYVEDTADTDYRYDDLTNKDIKDDMLDSVFEYEIYGIDEIDFIKEPNNEFDENAIKVCLKNYGQVGYISKSDNIQFGKLLDEYKKYETELRIKGGNMKYYDLDSDSVKKKKLSYGIDIDVNFYKDL